MTRATRVMVMGACVLAFSAAAPAGPRFPPPKFTDHELPVTEYPAARSLLLEYLDVGVLVCALAAVTYLALKRRSRRGVFVAMLLSLAYFGFYRQGCVCSIGAIQNVAMALAGGGYAIPLAVLAMFVLPLAFTLAFGRTFCAGVCPLGAIQDIVLLKPLKVPTWLGEALGVLAYVYLGAAVLLAATGGAMLICRYDPFVAMFRLSGSWNMLVLGGCVLLIGVFVGRPYCRFLCPYGVLLRHLSRASRWHVTITPDECVQCRLCDSACPFGAIRPATAEGTPVPRIEGKVRLAGLIVLLPVLLAAGGWLGHLTAPALARVHWKVRLAEQVRPLEAQLLDPEMAEQIEELPDAVNAFAGIDRPDPAAAPMPERIEALYAEAGLLRGRFAWGSAALGVWVALVVAGKLLAHSVRRRRTDYEAHRAECLSCGRCFEYCPIERKRLRTIRGTT